MIRLITSKDQLRVGQNVIGYSKTDHNSLPINHIINQRDIDIPDLLDKLWLEHISYPERRKLTWEWVKENIEELPLKVWYKDLLKDTVNLTCPKGWRDSRDIYHNYDSDSFFIDPPYPEIPLVQEPWLKNTPIQDPDALKKAFDKVNSHQTQLEDKPSLWWMKFGVDKPYLSHVYRNKKNIMDCIGNDKICVIQPYTPESQFGPIEGKWESVS